MADLIDDHFGRLQDLILLFRIPMCTRKDFFENLCTVRTRPSNVPQLWSVHFSPDVQDMSTDFCLSGSVFSGSRLTERLASSTVVNEVSPTRVRETVEYLTSKERLGTTSRSAPFPITCIG